MKRLLTFTLAGLLVSSTAVSAQVSQVPMPSTEGGSSSPEPSNAPPPPRQTSPLGDAAGHAVTVVGAGEQLHNVAGAVGQANDMVDQPMAKTSTKFMGRAVTTLQVGQIGIEAANGNYATATRKGAAMVIDRCVDAALAGGCAVMSAPTAETAFPACQVAVQAAKFCAETAAGKSFGDWAVEKAEAGYDRVRAFVTEKRRDHDLARANQQTQFTTAQTSNDQQAIAIAGQQQSAPQGYQDDGSSALTAALMSGILAATPSQPPVPMAPAPAANGACHSGHDESAHPGGCHSAPLSAH